MQIWIVLQQHSGHLKNCKDMDSLGEGEGGDCYWGTRARKVGKACLVGTTLLLQFISHHTSYAETIFLCGRHPKL